MNVRQRAGGVKDGDRKHRLLHTQCPLALAVLWPLQLCLLCLLCPQQFSLADPQQVVQFGERFQGSLVRGSIHTPWLCTLLHSLLQLRLQGEGYQRPSEAGRKPAAEYFVTNDLRKAKRADCCLVGAVTNALLLPRDWSKMYLLV